MSLKLRAVLDDLLAYRPGRRPQEGQADIARLASNELPHGLDPRIVSAVSAVLTTSNRYPDPAAGELVAALAARHSIDEANVVVGCGSVQLLQELVAATSDAGDEVVYPWRSFEAYPTLTQIAGAGPRPVPLRGTHIDLYAIAEAVTDGTRLVILCSPNNPVGPALTHEGVRALLSRLPGDVVVALDEAYAEYVTDPAAVRGLELLDDHANLVVLRTFSKAYGLAGLRVGYAVCADALLAGALRKLHLPFSVSAPAQAAALTALSLNDDMLRQVSETIQERDQLVTVLRAVGWKIPDAQGNFVWLPAGDASSSLTVKFDEAGILARCFDGEGVRVTVGTSVDNARVTQVASAWLDLQPAIS